MHENHFELLSRVLVFVSLKVDHLRSIDNYSVTVNHLPEFCKEEVGRFIVAAIIFYDFFFLSSLEVLDY